MNAVELSHSLSPLTARFEGAERRQTLAHGVSRGYRRAKRPSPGGATGELARVVSSSRSIAPDGARIFPERYPTAYAVGYGLSLLRSYGPECSGDLSEGAERRQTAAHMHP